MPGNQNPFTDPTQDPSNYWMNTFYYNREDKRLFPPKRIPALGLTINFAHPAAALVVLVLLASVFVGML